MADPVAAARNFLNALERIPSIIDQYKAKNEVLEKGGSAVAGDSGQGVEEGGRTETVGPNLPRLTKRRWSLRRPQEVTEKEKNGQEIKARCGRCTGISPQQTDDVPQIRSPMDKRQKV